MMIAITAPITIPAMSPLERPPSLPAPDFELELALRDVDDVLVPDVCELFAFDKQVAVPLMTWSFFACVIRLHIVLLVLSVETVAPPLTSVSEGKLRLQHK